MAAPRQSLPVRLERRLIAERIARFRHAFDMASGSEIFWMALSEGPVGLELRGAVRALSFSCSEAHPERPRRAKARLGGTKTVERSDG
jgi:hypothetical protein